MVGERFQVLIAEDEPHVRAVVEAVCSARDDCEVESVADGQEAYERLVAKRCDLLITDLRMPRLGGEILSARALELNPDITILVETGNPTLDGAIDLLRGGVYDFITKPFVVEDLERAVHRAIERSRSRRVAPSLDASVESLMAALGRKDKYLRFHGQRVAKLCTLMGQDLGLTHSEIKELAWMGLVHDVGKIGISDAILVKPGRLTEDEFEAIRQHPIYSAEIIAPLADLRGWRRSVPGVRHHHERVDGKGYPDGLCGEQIPLESRIIAVCDTYDAMSSSRPYQAACGADELRMRIDEASGSQLDADLVDLFLENFDRYRAHAHDA